MKAERCLLCALAIPLALAGSTAFSDIVAENEFIRVEGTAGRITALRFDAAGQGEHGPSFVAEGHAIESAGEIRLEGNRLVLSASGRPMVWPVPFVRAGYYDAINHLNYPDPKTTDGATPLLLPVRRLVGGSGQTLLIEYFKRLPRGLHNYPLCLGEDHLLLLGGDDSLNHDVRVDWPAPPVSLDENWPTEPVIRFEVAEDHLDLRGETTGEPIVIEVVPRGAEAIPGSPFEPLRGEFTPDATVTFEPTGASASLNAMLNELLQFGVHWHPGVIPGGDWGESALEIHALNDPRARQWPLLRRAILRELGHMGHDRWGHFGLLFSWGTKPDYGAPGLFNLPPGPAPWDARFLHMNPLWCSIICRYVLLTGDAALLDARRARWVSTDGAEEQPICGADADWQDWVLAAGDFPGVGGAAAKHTLGQEFTASAPFTTVSARLGNPSTGGESNSGTLTLFDAPGGSLIGQRHFSIPPDTTQVIGLRLDAPQPPGRYYLEVADDSSGVTYWGPGVTWWTDLDSDCAGGEAHSGPFHGTVWEQMKLMMDYTFRWSGPERFGICSHDPSLGFNAQRSGRDWQGCTTTSYHETMGGGKDAFSSAWWIEALARMEQVAQLRGDADCAQLCRERREVAQRAYSETFWGTADDNGRAFSRFYLCEDWDGNRWDFGFTYFNLVAALRGAATSRQAREILWWLDRGQFSPDGGTTWRDHIYSIWEIAAPLNTVENSTWLNITGTLPWLNVLANGGTRTEYAGVDLRVRSRFHSVDNLHERVGRILRRFISPDRLTGGRICNDPAGRGRWHFLDPDTDVADIEGFREIFPGSGALATGLVMAYLDLDPRTEGLRLRPRVPSEHGAFRFSGIGYHGATLSMTTEAQRTRVLDTPAVGGAVEVPADGGIAATFTPPAEFNRVGLLARVSPAEVNHDVQLSLTLERDHGGSWEEVASTWRNHLRDGQWVWLDAEQFLPPGAQYRVRAHAPGAPEGATLSLARGEGSMPGDETSLALRVEAETTRLTVETTHNPRGTRFTLAGTRSGCATTDLGDGRMRLVTTLDPGEDVYLRPEG